MTLLPLKKYQDDVLGTLETYLQTLQRAQRDALELRNTQIQRGERQALLDWPRGAWDAMESDGLIPHPQNAKVISTPHHSMQNEAGEHVPNICLKIPTGGGKTYLGAHAVELINTRFYHRDNGLVLWIVPSDAIYQQTINNFANPQHPCREVLKRAAANIRPNVIDRQNPFNRLDTEDNLTVMVITLQAFARQTTKRDQLRFFRGAVGYHSFHPSPYGPDGVRRAVRTTPNLDLLKHPINPNAHEIVHSLANAIRVCRPLIVLDESHRAKSVIPYEALLSLNPRFILELSATPNPARSNVLCDVTGTELYREDMIKLPITLNARVDDDNLNWKTTLDNASQRLKELQRSSDELRQNDGRYIRPILLVQTQHTGKKQRETSTCHAEDAREHLIQKLGYMRGEVAVKSSEIDEIGNQNLLDPNCPIRAVITRNALAEGWDCSFAYVLALLANTTAMRALTQLTGRILRMPHAQRTTDESLNKAHIFTANQDVAKVIEKIHAALHGEGLDNLDDVVEIEDDGGSAQHEKIEAKEQFRSQNIFLPRVLHKNDDRTYRPLDYARDILQTIPWNDVSWKQAPKYDPRGGTFGQSHTVEIDLHGERHTSSQQRDYEGQITQPSFFVRHMHDVTPNPWFTAHIVRGALKNLRTSYDEKTIYAHRGHILEDMQRDLSLTVEKHAKEIFEKKILNKNIRFHLTALPRWKMKPSVRAPIPSKHAQRLRRANGEPVERNFFSEIPTAKFNDLEKNVALYLDEQHAVEWWHRIVSRGECAYHLQGWRKNNIYPDLLVSIAQGGAQPPALAVLEVKGDHLKGNDDTQYKLKLFKMLENAAAEDVGIFQTRLKNTKLLFRIILQGCWRREIDEALRNTP